MHKLALIGNDVDLIDQIILDKIQLCGIIDKIYRKSNGCFLSREDKDFKILIFLFFVRLMKKKEGNY